MKHRIKELVIGGENFRDEFRKQGRYLVTFTLGFTIAFTWRQTIFDSSEYLLKLITHLEGPVALSILTSLFITIISVIIIFFTSKILKDKRSYVGAKYI